MKIAIIGAGMAGLSCATRLKSGGHDVVLHDKGRGPGGRMSTRRSDSPLGETSFDHGAQYFKVASPEFSMQCDDWLDAGVIAKWPAAGENALVGVPGMNAPIKAVAAALDVSWGSRVETIERTGTAWRLTGVDDNSSYDAVVVAVPAEQAGVLLKPWDADMASAANAVVSEPSWTVMLAFAGALQVDADIIKGAGAIGWAARNNSKPGRTGIESWVIQASVEWSDQNLEEQPEAIIAMLSAEFAKSANITLPEPAIMMAHRWRYAQPSAAISLEQAWNSDINLGVCGDWLAGGKVEQAWLSGYRLAGQITG